MPKVTRYRSLSQQPLSRPLDQQQITGALADVILPHFLDLVIVEFDFLFAQYVALHRLKQARIEWFRFPCRLQVLGQLPRLKDRLDLRYKCRDLVPEVGVGSAASRKFKNFSPTR